MDWIKKNLFLVVGSVVALALLGLAGFFLYSKYILESEVSANLQAQTEELDRLSRLRPHPGDRKVDNIKAAKDQDLELQQFAKQLRETFVPINSPTNLASGELKLLLDSALDDLQRSAQRAGVKTPANFAFGFSSQRTQVSFDQNVIKPLTFAIEEIRAMSKVLFDARILTLDSIRRVPIGSTDGGAMASLSAAMGPGDTWPKKPSTNSLAILTPYEFTFHCFTPELASVLQGLAQNPHGFLIKNVQVDTVPSSLLETNSLDSPAMPTPMLGMGGMNPAMMARYGIGRYGGRPMAPPPEEATQTGPTPTRRGGLNIMLEEKPFRVVMWVDVLRLLDPNEAQPSRSRSRVVPAADGTEAAAADGTPAEATTN